MYASVHRTDYTTVSKCIPRWLRGTADACRCFFNLFWTISATATIRTPHAEPTALAMPNVACHDRTVVHMQGVGDVVTSLVWPSQRSSPLTFRDSALIAVDEETSGRRSFGSTSVPFTRNLDDIATTPAFVTATILTMKPLAPRTILLPKTRISRQSVCENRDKKKIDTQYSRFVTKSYIYFTPLMHVDAFLMFFWRDEQLIVPVPWGSTAVFLDLRRRRKGWRSQVCTLLRRIWQKWCSLAWWTPRLSCQPLAGWTLGWAGSRRRCSRIRLRCCDHWDAA